MISPNYLFENFKKIIMSGGGFFAFTLTALQTTLLSFHVAHQADASQLAVFGFLLSLYYFSMQLLKRNVIEPYFSFGEILGIRQDKLQISMVIAFATSISAITSLISENYSLTLSMMVLISSSIFWEMRKAELRYVRKILIYTVLEILILLFLIVILVLDSAGISISSNESIVGLASMQIFSLVITKDIPTAKNFRLGEGESRVNLSSSSQNEFLYVGVILFSNAYLIHSGYLIPLGEIRSIFLILTLSTFTVGALRNSLALSYKWSKINVFLLACCLINIFLVLFLPNSILRSLIPSIPLQPKYLILVVSIDILGSLLFVLTSMKLLKIQRIKESARSRQLSSILIVMAFFIFLPSPTSAVQVALLYALPSIIGGIHLFSLFVLLRAKNQSGEL